MGKNTTKALWQFITPVKLFHCEVFHITSTSHSWVWMQAPIITYILKVRWPMLFICSSAVLIILHLKGITVNNGVRNFSAINPDHLEEYEEANGKPYRTIKSWHFVLSAKKLEHKGGTMIQVSYVTLSHLRSKEPPRLIAKCSPASLGYMGNAYNYRGLCLVQLWGSTNIHVISMKDFELTMKIA